ncbi:MAG: hypothetical protein JO022_15940 [Acidobacteriaceae bacterium]|nr:hypothetical protein [Acidobacteriaceae bacterium]
MSASGPLPRQLAASWVRVAAAGVLALAVAVFLVQVIASRDALLDDAYIGFRFARNLAQGQGLVWNPGGERVEGFTSILHIGLLAAAVRADIPAPDADRAMLILAVFGTVTVLLTRLRKEAQTAFPVCALLLAIWIADPNTAALTSAGLETQIFVLCLASAWSAAIAYVNRPSQPAALATAAAVFCSLLCRPDGAIYGAALYAGLLVHVWTIRRSPQGRRAARSLAISLVLLIAAVAAYAAAKYLYFGYLLPNPFYVKSNKLSLNGAGYIKRYLAHLALFLGPVAAVIAGVLFAQRKQSRPAQALLSKALLTLAPPLLALCYYSTITHEVGGYHRFSYPTYF